MLPHRRVADQHPDAGRATFETVLDGGHLLQRFDDVSRDRWDRMAWTMVRTQEDGGEWWDTAAADYGDKWGTGMAICVLQHSLSAFENTRSSLRITSSKSAVEPITNLPPPATENAISASFSSRPST